MSQNECDPCLKATTNWDTTVDTKLNYITAFAVIRIDDGPLDHPSRVREWPIRGEPTAGPSNVTVKEVVMSAEEARKEVVRMNDLNSSKECSYYWQSTHVFFDGGSHGSASRTADNDANHA